jgi:hypothetical protein
MIEFILTIYAWRKGWGPVALLPLAVGLPIGIFSAGATNSILPAVMADLLIYAALITMIVAGREKNTPAQAIPAPSSPEFPRQTAA